MYLLYLTILCGFIFSKGFFTLQSITLTLTAFILFILLLTKDRFHKISTINIKALLLISTLLMTSVYGSLYQTISFYTYLSYLLLGISVLFTFLLNYTNKEPHLKKMFLILLLLAISLKVLMIVSSPNPYIDVFDYTKYGGSGLIKGINPYSNTYTPLYEGVTPNYYGYLPGMIILTLPSIILTNDPRYTFILSELLVAFIIYKITAKKKGKYIYTLLFLFNPISPFIIEQSYTEPLLVALIALTVYFILLRRIVLSTFIFGIALATKQYLIIFIPLYLKLLQLCKQRIFLFSYSLLISLLVITPFLVWDPKEFLADAIFLQYDFAPRYAGLTFFSLIHKFGFSYNIILSGILIALFSLPVYFMKLSKSCNFFYYSAFIFLTFFIFNKWAFVNYFYLVSQLLFLGIVSDERYNK